MKWSLSHESKCYDCFVLSQKLIVGAFAVGAGLQSRGTSVNAAQDGCGLLARVLLFPTRVWAAHASFLKPSVVCAWSGRCCNNVWPTQARMMATVQCVKEIFQISIWKMNVQSDGGRGWCVDPCSLLLCFYPSFDCLRYGFQCMQTHRELHTPG